MKMHIGGGQRLLAACDEELLGKTFSGGGARLKVSEIFYKGETVSEEAFAERMKSATAMNLVGTRAIGIAKREGRVSEGNVMTIGGIEHAQAAVM